MADYGCKITTDNVDQRIASVTEGCHRFKNRSPELWQWTLDKINTYSSQPDLPPVDTGM